MYFNAASVTDYYDNRTISSYTSTYANFSCPLGAGIISSCYDNATTVKDCSRGFGGFLVVECSHSMYLTFDHLVLIFCSLLVIDTASLERVKMLHRSEINANSRDNKDLYKVRQIILYFLSLKMQYSFYAF